MFLSFFLSFFVFSVTCLGDYYFEQAKEGAPVARVHIRWKRNGKNKKVCRGIAPISKCRQKLSVISPYVYSIPIRQHVTVHQMCTVLTPLTPPYPHTPSPHFLFYFKLHSIFITWTKIRPPRRAQLSQSSPRNVWQIADGNSPIIIQRTLVNLRCQLNLHHQWDSEVVGLNRIVRACVREDRNSGGLMGKDGLSPLDFGFQFLPDNCARDVSERVSE